MDLSTYLTEAARRRAYREAMGIGQPAAVSPPSMPQAGVGSQRAGNQKGGMTTGGWPPPVQRPHTMASSASKDGQGGGWLGHVASGLMGFATGGPLGAGAAILGSIAGSSGGSRRQAQQSSTTASRQAAYNQAQERALRGEVYIDPSLTQGQWSEGMAAVNAQAQQSREALASNLASRGVLHSGIYGSGLADVERARLRGVEGLALALAQQAMNYRTQAQESAMNREAGMIQQRVGIEAQKPEWWETVAQAAPAVAQYLQTRNQPPTPDWGALLGQVLGQGQVASATPGAPVRYVAPMPDADTSLSLARQPVATQDEPWRLRLTR